MAEQKLVVEGEFLDAGEQRDADLDAAFWQFRESLEADDNAGGGNITVYELPLDETGAVRGKTLRQVKLFSTAVGSMTIDDITDKIVREFMLPGERKVFRLVGTMAGRRGILMNKQVSLAKAQRVEKVGDDSSVASLIKMFQEQSSRDRNEMRQMMTELISAKNSAPAIDPTQFGFMLVDKLTALTQRIAPPAGGMMGGGNDNPLNQMMSMMMMDMMKNLMANAKRNNEPREPAGGGLSEIVGSIAGVVKPFLEIKAAEARAANAPRLAAPVPAAQPVQTTDATPEVAPTDPKEAAKMKLLKDLKEALPMMCELAANNAEIPEVVKLVSNTLPNDDDVNEALFMLLSDKSCLAQLALLEPKVRDHAEWFEKFRVALLAEITPDEPATEATPS